MLQMTQTQLVARLTQEQALRQKLEALPSICVYVRYTHSFMQRHGASTQYCVHVFRVCRLRLNKPVLDSVS